MIIRINHPMEMTRNCFTNVPPIYANKTSLLWIFNVLWLLQVHDNIFTLSLCYINTPNLSVCYIDTLDCFQCYCIQFATLNAHYQHTYPLVTTVFSFLLFRFSCQIASAYMTNHMGERYSELWSIT